MTKAQTNSVIDSLLNQYVLSSVNKQAGVHVGVIDCTYFKTLQGSFKNTIKSTKKQEINFMKIKKLIPKSVNE